MSALCLPWAGDATAEASKACLLLWNKHAEYAVLGRLMGALHFVSGRRSYIKLMQSF